MPAVRETGMRRESGILGGREARVRASRSEEEWTVARPTAPDEQLVNPGRNCVALAYTRVAGQFLPWDLAWFI